MPIHFSILIGVATGLLAGPLGWLIAAPIGIALFVVVLALHQAS